MGLLGFFSKKEAEKLDQGLTKTRDSLLSRIGKVVLGKSQVDENVLDDLEEALVSSDVGVATTLKIIERIENRVKKEKYFGSDELNKILKEEIKSLLSENITPDFSAHDPVALPKPYVVMVVGVNGVGKTTTIGKLAHKYKDSGKSVLVGAADTFRAAAVDQLSIWAARAGARILSQGMGADPASVAYKTVDLAIEEKIDVVIIDTAGRLHNKINLMAELSKIRRVIQKKLPDAPHEVLLILDGSTGQNAFEQARQFVAATEVTALAITKLDGTAKGGVVIGVSDQFNIPVKYIGIGEGIDDLQLFDRHNFVEALFQR